MAFHWLMNKIMSTLQYKLSIIYSVRYISLVSIVFDNVRYILAEYNHYLNGVSIGYLS
jgi:hypothetical protein